MKLTISEIKETLQCVKLNHSIRNVKPIRDELAQIKRECVAVGDESGAKETWCLEKILALQELYLRAFKDLKRGKYYDAWYGFDRVDITYHHLSRHLDLSDGEYSISFIVEISKLYQSLFPYQVFLSPGMIYKEKRCSICHQIVSPRTDCGHVSGEIYSGEMCGREITSVELLEVSWVDKPAQKYSVVFPVNPETGEREDHYDYRVLSWLIAKLPSPFDGWSVDLTKQRHPHILYRAVGRNEKCPCESGKKYKHCCLREAGVLRPHYQFTFENQPPGADLTVKYSRIDFR